MENSDNENELEAFLSAQGTDGALAGGRQERVTDRADFVRVGPGLSEPRETTIEDLVMEGSIPLASNVLPIRGASAQDNAAAENDIDSETQRVNELFLEATSAEEQPESAEKKISVEEIKEEIRVRHMMMVEHSLADLAASIKNGQKNASFDINSVSKHKLWAEMSLMDKLKNPMFKLDENGVPEASILRSFVANNAPLSSKTARIKTVLIPYDIYPRDEALGLTGIDFGRSGNGAIEMGDDTRDQLKALVERLETAQKTLRKSGENLLDTLNARSGVQRVIGRLSENLKVQSAYRNYESAATELIEFRNYLLSKDIDTNESDRMLSRSELFADLFIKRETTSWEAMANTQRRVKEITRALEKGTYLNPTVANPGTATAAATSAPLQQPSTPEPAEQMAAVTTEPAANNKAAEVQKEAKQDSLDITVAGITYTIPKKSPLFNILDPAKFAALEEDRTYIHPEIPVMWEIAKIQAEDRKDFEALKKLRKGIPPSFTRLPFEGYHRNPAEAIENYLSKGVPFDQESHLQYSGKLRSVFGESSNGKNLAEFVSASSLKGNLKYSLSGKPSANIDIDFPFEFPSQSRFAKNNLPHQKAPNGKKLAHPLLALAWEMSNKRAEVLIAENTIQKRGIFSKEIKPTLEYKKNISAVDAFGKPIEFPDCFYVDSDVEIKGGSAVVLVNRYKALAARVGNDRAKKEFTNDVMKYISEEDGLKGIHPYFINETDVLIDHQMTIFEDSDVNAHKDKLAIGLKKAYMQEQRNNPQGKHLFGREQAHAFKG